MGWVRGWNYDAVIGVGGMGNEPRDEGIAGKVTWIGKRPTHYDHPIEPLVSFEDFVHWGSASRHDFREIAPTLSARMYRKGHHVRTTIITIRKQTEWTEVQNILALPFRKSQRPINHSKPREARKSRGRIC
jgi:hypothetical protein